MRNRKVFEAVFASAVALATLGSFVVLRGDPPSSPPGPARPEPAQLAEWVREALDRGKPLPARHAAVRRLRADRAVGPLSEVLPPAGDWDGVTLAAVEALADLGDPAALHAIRRAEGHVHEDVHGEFWVLWEMAAKKLEREAAKQDRGRTQ
jgi:hypothetical protein